MALIGVQRRGGSNMPGVSREDITAIDAGGEQVFELVMEVTLRMVGGVREPKADYHDNAFVKR